MNHPSEMQTADYPKLDPVLIREGIIGGIIGAFSIAIWFLIADSIQGRPFYTPSVLGTVLIALMKGGAGLASLESVPASFGMVLMFSIIHGMAFLGIGVLGSWLLHLAERDVSYGFNVVLLLVFFAFGFTFLNMVLAGVVLNALSITDIMIAHLVAIATMACFYSMSHKGLSANL